MNAESRREAFVRQVQARALFMKAALSARPRRRVLPRQMQPDTIRMSYYAALRAFVEAAHDLVGEMLLPELPALFAAAALERGDARLDAAGDDIHRRMKAIVDRYFKRFTNEKLGDTASEFGRRTSDFQRIQLARQFKAGLGIDVVMTEPSLAPRIAAFTAENVSLIKSIPVHYFDEIEKLTIAGARGGQRWEEIQDDLTDRFNVSKSRAQVVARDQVGKFYGELNRVRQVDLGVEGYRWRGVLDNRERSEHLDREGNFYRWDDPPADGNPGEPVQCRCYGEPDLTPILEAL